MSKLFTESECRQIASRVSGLPISRPAQKPVSELGGSGAGLDENPFFTLKDFKDWCINQVDASIAQMETTTGRSFADAADQFASASQALVLVQRFESSRGEL